jgi:ADP-L-glycero-D-manno-heptose 6-epimerase
MVARAYEQIRATGQVQLFRSYRSDYADGWQRRDFLYVKDAVAMTIFLGNVDEFVDGRPTVGIYNIGSGTAHTWIELVTPIFEALQKPLRIQYIEMPEKLREKYQYYSCANINKIRSAGYGHALTPLEDAVRDYVTHYLMEGKRLGE